MSIVTEFPRETGLEQWLCIMKGSSKIWLLWLVVVQVWLSACWRRWGHSTISFKSFMTHWGPEGFWGIWWSSDYIILKETEAWQYWKIVTSTTITGIDTQQQEDGQAFDFVFPSHLFLSLSAENDAYCAEGPFLEIPSQTHLKAWLLIDWRFKQIYYWG